jgi:hypothetical protein
MRRLSPPTFLRLLFLALALAFVGGRPHSAFADDRSEARTHYQAGVKFYAGGDYRSAIREFSAAQQLAPADLNNYNLALCYDKLGDAEPAVQYYRAYLDKNPNTDKRAEIDASIQRLDAAAKSAAAKKAEEQKRIEAAKKAEEDRLAAEAASKAALKAEQDRLAAEAAQRRMPPEQPDPMMPKPANSGFGGAGTVATQSPQGTGTVSTGDSQLDRVQGIDINAIRDQRGGGAGPAADPRGAGTVAMGANGTAGVGPATAAPTGATAGAPNGQNPNGAPMNGEPPKAETPIYKKWWFWAVVAVSAYVVYQIATDDASSSNSARMLPEVGGAKGGTAQPGGLTLMSW